MVRAGSDGQRVKDDVEYDKRWDTDVQGSNCGGGAGSRAVGDLRC